MTVSELIEVLKNEYDGDAEVVVVDWSTGRTYDISVGGDDLDEGTAFCRIGLN